MNAIEIIDKLINEYVGFGVQQAVLIQARERLRAVSPEEAAHPWQAFLDARADAIDWMHANGKSDAMIAPLLSMDVTQVFLIRTRDRSLEERQ